MRQPDGVVRVPCRWMPIASSSRPSLSCAPEPAKRGLGAKPPGKRAGGHSKSYTARHPLSPGPAMAFLLLSPAKSRRHLLVPLVLLALISLSPLLAGFMPPAAIERAELSVGDQAPGEQGGSESWESQLARAKLLRAQGRYEEAATAFRTAMTRAPNAASVGLSAAEADLAARDYRAVLDLTATVLASNPGASDAYALRGEAF